MHPEIEPARIRSVHSVQLIQQPRYLFYSNEVLRSARRDGGSAAFVCSYVDDLVLNQGVGPDTIATSVQKLLQPGDVLSWQSHDRVLITLKARNEDAVLRAVVGVHSALLQLPLQQGGNAGWPRIHTGVSIFPVDGDRLAPLLTRVFVAAQAARGDTLVGSRLRFFKPGFLLN